MSDGINLRDIERRAFLSYHEDGLLDVMIGFGIILSGLWMYAEMPWLIGAFVPVFTPIYIQSKKKITVPRLGQVEFSERRKGKMKKTMLALVIFNVILFIAGLYAWFAMDIGGRPQWLIDLLSNYMIIFGIFGGIISVVVGFLSDLKRFHLYGIINLIIFTIANNYTDHPAFGLCAMGLVVVINGFVLLKSFMRKYPIYGVDQDV